MMYCDNCRVELFGGSVCHICGGELVPKEKDQGPKVAHIRSDVIMGGKKKLTVDTAQSLSGRLFRLTFEILIFCVLFYGVAFIVASAVNWLSREMSMNPESAPIAIDVHGNGFKYFRWFGLVAVAILTIRFRFQSGK